MQFRAFVSFLSGDFDKSGSGTEREAFVFPQSSRSAVVSILTTLLTCGKPMKSNSLRRAHALSEEHGSWGKQQQSESGAPSDQGTGLFRTSYGFSLCI